jgi:hypothetical protein
MTKIEEIEQKIKDLTNEINDLQDDLNELKQPTTFEVGKVYKTQSPGLNMYVSKYKHYGFSESLTWVSGHAWFENPCNGTWQPATTQEWETALLEYAKKQGYKRGINIKPLPGGSSFIDEGFFGVKDIFYYNSENDDLQLNGSRIYQRGQWAKIVKEEPLMIGGVEVEIKHNRVTLGRFTYPKAYLESLRKTCRDFNEPITTELLTKIIDKLK